MIRIKNPNYLPRIPEEYQEVEYIESTGTQYIDTGIGITTVLSFECEWEKTASGAGLSGSYYFVSSTQKAFCFGLYSDNKLYVGVGSTTDTSVAGALNIKYKTIGNSTTMITYQDGVSKASVTGALTANNLNFYLFATHRNQETSGIGTGYYGQYKIYTCKLYENDILVRDFIPCYRKSDNVIGLYDLVNNIFYTNSGTGVFLIGQELNTRDVNINPKITGGNQINTGRLPNEYKEIEYLESTGTQWIDTGVPAFSKNRTEIDLQFTDLTKTSYNGYGRMIDVGSDNHNIGAYWSGSGEKVFLWQSIGTGGRTQTADTDRHVFFLDNNNEECGLDNIIVSTDYCYNESSYQEGETLHLFAMKWYDLLDDQMLIKWTAYEKVYGAKYYLDGVLVRDFVPCIRKGDNKPGMYDLVNNQFYTNQGTGEFLTAQAYPLIRRYIGDKLAYGEPKDYEQLVNYTMLYDYGNECTSLTGGWKVFNKGSVTKNSNNMVIPSYNGGGAGFGTQTTNMIGGLTQYSQAGAVSSWSITSEAGTQRTNAIRIFQSDTIVAEHVLTTSGLATAAKGLRTTDISDNSLDSAYIAYECYYARTYTATIYAIFLLKPDDYLTLAQKAGINAASINDILTNATILLNNEDAVNFMIRQCTGDFMANAVQNSTFLTALSNSPYNTKIQANEHWNKFLTMVA